MATPETQLVPKSPKKRAASTEAHDLQEEAGAEDQHMNHQLAAREGEQLEVAPPPWVLSLQTNMTNIMSKLDRVLVQNEDLSMRVGHLESRAGEDRERVHSLELKVQEIQKALDGAKSSASKSEGSSGHGVAIPPPSSLVREEADFNHIVLGGWPQDTRKQIIEGHIQALIRQFDVPDVCRLAVNGKRAWV